MKKKILIGSIIAVVILVMVSFSGVVGYQTTKSSTISKASPLFSVRSSRAIDKKSNDLNCEYVGKGIPISIAFPKRNYTLSIIKKIIDIMRIEEDIQFNRLIFNENDKISILKTIQLIGDNFDILENYKIGINKDVFRNRVIKLDTTSYTLGNWYPRCFIDRLLYAIETVIILLLWIYAITNSPETSILVCDTWNDCG